MLRKFWDNISNDLLSTVFLFVCLAFLIGGGIRWALPSKQHTKSPPMQQAPWGGGSQANYTSPATQTVAPPSNQAIQQATQHSQTGQGKGLVHDVMTNVLSGTKAGKAYNAYQIYNQYKNPSSTSTQGSPKQNKTKSNVQISIGGAPKKAWKLAPTRRLDGDTSLVVQKRSEVEVLTEDDLSAPGDSPRLIPTRKVK